ncbi:hypothetical protein [Luteimonas mephitis]|uniref:hypothetical protein n=1 Tax=Luteimonas mephitis TaxID=83615 RepID=UPI003A919C75
MAVRAYAPAVVALVVAMVSMAVLWSWQSNPQLAGFVQIGRWLPLLALVATFGLLVAPTYRLLRWHRGRGPCCPVCSGPLGHERAGHARMGGAYRRCYACGKAVNHKHYASAA